VAQFLRGLVTGLVAFAVFCFVVAELLPSAGIAAAFLVASAAALASHALVAALRAGQARLVPAPR
jgi:hypothetical protein